MLRGAIVPEQGTNRRQRHSAERPARNAIKFDMFR
jgi:hypothetical protein